MEFIRDIALPLDMGGRFALVLIAGIVFAEIAQRHLSLPRIVGYLIGGSLFGPSVLGVIHPAEMAMLNLVVEMVVGLMAFELGSRVDLGWLRNNRWLLATGVLEAAATFVAVLAALRLFGVGRDTALLVSAISIATSPTIVVRIVHELDARGQVTERLLLLAALNGIFAIVAFKALVAFVELDRGPAPLSAMLQPVYLLSGSFLLGLVSAAVLRFVFRLFSPQGGDAFVLALSTVLLSGTVAYQFQLFAPLALLLGGLLLRRKGARMTFFPPHFGTAGAVLVLLLFVLTGIGLDLAMAFAGGAAALAAVVARLLAKSLVTGALAVPSGLSMRKGFMLGVALTPMSSLALALARYPRLERLAEGAEVQALVTGCVVILELAGPVLCALAIRRAGEERAPIGGENRNARTVQGF